MNSIDFIMKRSCSYSFHNSLFFFFVSVFLVMSNISNVGEAIIKLPENETIPAVIAFGDSILDQGNNNKLFTVVKCNFLPYGKDLTDGAAASGRFSNGRTPPDFIAEELGIKYMLPAYLDPELQAEDLLTGVSFASGASGYDPQTSQLTSVLSLPQQLEMFKEYIQQLKEIIGEENANFIIKKSFYLVVSGSDDLANTYFTIAVRQAQYDINSYADLMVAYASTFIKELYELGARRIAVFNIPPIGCVPSQRTLKGGPSRQCVEYQNQAAQLVNSKLSFAIQSLGPVLPQSKIIDIDVYTPLLDLIQNPQNYGFEVADKGCCGTGDLEVSILCNPKTPTCIDATKYIFWDSYHPTEKGYKILVHELLLKYIHKFF